MIDADADAPPWLQYDDPWFGRSCVGEERRATPRAAAAANLARSYDDAGTLEYDAGNATQPCDCEASAGAQLKPRRTLMRPVCTRPPAGADTMRRRWRRAAPPAPRSD